MVQIQLRSYALYYEGPGQGERIEPPVHGRMHRRTRKTEPNTLAFPTLSFKLIHRTTDLGVPSKPPRPGSTKQVGGEQWRNFQTSAEKKSLQTDSSLSSRTHIILIHCRGQKQSKRNGNGSVSESIARKNWAKQSNKHNAHPRKKQRSYVAVT